MTQFETVAPTEAHPTRDEYVVERDLGDGRWVVDSISPAPIPEQAATDAASFIGAWPDHDAAYRIVRRTITSTVIAVHPNPKENQA
ncbi:MAG: hypothetical protein HOV68_06060 [Streptomycetaceae bacterium]|nr:hypothetical protein [Streptomycetaceae bacterium]